MKLTTHDPLHGIEFRFHSAIPNWCKLVGLKIKPVPDCEGGGFMLDRRQAIAIMDLIANRPHHRVVLGEPGSESLRRRQLR